MIDRIASKTFSSQFMNPNNSQVVDVYQRFIIAIKNGINILNKIDAIYYHQLQTQKNNCIRKMRDRRIYYTMLHIIKVNYVYCTCCEQDYPISNWIRKIKIYIILLPTVAVCNVCRR